MAEKKNKKILGISAIAVIDNLVFSKTDCWAFYKVTNDVFDFLSHSQKHSLAVRINNALANVVSDKDEPLEYHLITTSIPIDVDNWERQVRQMAEENNNPAPGFDNFVNEQVRHLKEQDFLQKVAYIGFNIGKRGALNMSNLNVLDMGVKVAKDTIKEWAKTMLHSPNSEISAKEEASFRSKEEEYARIMRSGNLRGERVEAEEILIFMKSQYYPTIPVPPLNSDYEHRFGAGDILNETAHVIENKYRWLRVGQMYKQFELYGYRATLTFTEFPKKSYYPLGTFPFMYFPAKLGVPFTMYSRGFLTPTSNLKAEVEKKKKEQKDELENVTTGQDQYDSAINGVPSETITAIGDLNEISDIIGSNKMPWVQGSYYLVVEAPEEDVLRDYCNRLKQEYDDLGIKLQWTAGDQAQLLLESMPGDRIRSKSFTQTTNLEMLSTSGFNFSSDIGDNILFESEK